MPTPAETMRHVWKPNGNTHAAVCTDDFEEDVEDGVVDGIGFELGGFGDGDEEDGKDDPPDVMGELAAQLLADEVGAGFLGGGVEVRRVVVVGGAVGVGREDSSDCAECVIAVNASSGAAFSTVGNCVRKRSFCFRPGVVGIYTKRPFFVYVGVTHSDDDGIDGNIHHDHVEDEEANAKTSNGNNIEAARTDSESLEEAVKSSGTWRKRRYDRIADLSID